LTKTLLLIALIFSDIPIPGKNSHIMDYVVWVYRSILGILVALVLWGIVAWIVEYFSEKEQQEKDKEIEQQTASLYNENTKLRSIISDLENKDEDL
jgi:cytoskeletal protein RodZ